MIKTADNRLSDIDKQLICREKKTITIKDLPAEISLLKCHESLSTGELIPAYTRSVEISGQGHPGVDWLSGAR